MRMTKEQAREAVLNVAINCASAEYAATIWSSGDWTWYELMREMLLLAVQEGRIPELTTKQCQFISFVKDHLAPHFPPRTSERDMFTARLRSPASDSARSLIPIPFNIDRCPVLLLR